jgi:hypothetical protein
MRTPSLSSFVCGRSPDLFMTSCISPTFLDQFTSQGIVRKLSPPSISLARLLFRDFHPQSGIDFTAYR